VGQLKVDPEKVVEARRNARAKVQGRTVPLYMKVVLQDSLCDSHETFLIFEVADCPVVENKHVRPQMWLKAGQLMKVEHKRIPQFLDPMLFFSHL
jgi:hypothetical protein